MQHNLWVMQAYTKKGGFIVRFPQSGKNFEAGSTCSKGTKPCAKTAAATELLECIGVFTQAALAPSTQNTYKRAWTTFESFFSGGIRSS